MKKVVVIGPECSGKSTLSAELAEHYETHYVPEYARYYIDNLKRPYKRHDLLQIALGQLEWEEDYISNASELLICDTDLRVIKIWEEYKYGECHPEILEHINTRKYDLYLFTNVDIPWENDPQREHEEQREFFYNLYEKELQQQSIPIVDISGSAEQRKRKAISAIDSLLTNGHRKS